MTNYVVDASVILGVLLPDEALSKKYKQIWKQFLRRTITFYAPELLDLEIGNTLLVGVKRNRLSIQAARDIFSVYELLPIEIETPSIEDVFRVASRHKITMYDASYVSLSDRKKLELLTLDKDLLKLVG